MRCEMKKNKVQNTGLYHLRQARKAGRVHSRDKLKQQGKAREVISSPRSLEIHESSWKEFSDWVVKEYDVKTLGKVNKEMLNEFIKYKSENGGRNGKGASVKTLKTYITGVNKVMLISGRWDKNDMPSLKKMDIKIKEEQKRIYKKESASDWLNKNQKVYERHKEYIDTVRAFGLRSREMKDLSKGSFFYDTKKDKMFATVIGKGGKLRTVESTKEMNEKMKEQYSRIALKGDISSFKSNKEKLLEYTKKQPLELRAAYNEHIPKHIFRSEYAQTLLKEKTEEYKSDRAVLKAYSGLKIEDKYKDIETTIKGHRGAVRAFYEVSENLGHNRLDVLTKYI